MSNVRVWASEKQKTLKSEMELHLDACHRRWTREREVTVYRVVRKVMGSSASSIEFCERTLKVLKTFTNPRSYPGQIKASPIRTQLGYVKGLTDGVHKTRQQLTRMTADYGQALPHLERIWRSDPARLKRWGEFEPLLSVLLTELEPVCKIAEQTLKGASGGQAQKRRNLIVAEARRSLQSCFGETLERSARVRFARLVKVLLQECGFSVDRVGDVLEAGLQERDDNRARKWRPLYIDGLGTTASGVVIKAANR